MVKAGAVLLLVVVALWAAGPAFACLAPMQPHACCHATAGCGMQAMGTDAACCQVHRPSPSEEPNRTATVSARVQLAAIAYLERVPAAPRERMRVSRGCETASLVRPPGASILRI